MDIAKGLYNEYGGDLGLTGKPSTPIKHWSDQSAQDFKVNEYGIPELTIYDFGNGGDKTTLYGQEALYNASSPTAQSLRFRYGLDSPIASKHLAFNGFDDPNDTIGARMGKWLHDVAESDKPTLLGRLYNKGPLAGAALTGLAGYGLGALADRLLPPGLVKRKTLGLLGGGLIGTIIGASREKNASVMEKEGATFQNPRNFILEKLQGAHDISTLQKAQLAAKIRMMDTASAERLKTIVRAAAGFGVGALIAKFFFGTGTVGTLIGGALGATVYTKAHGNDDKGRKYLIP